MSLRARVRHVPALRCIAPGWVTYLILKEAVPAGAASFALGGFLPYRLSEPPSPGQASVPDCKCMSASTPDETHKTHKTRNPSPAFAINFHLTNRPGISWKSIAKIRAKAGKSWKFFCAPYTLYLGKNRHSLQISRFSGLHRKSHKNH
jgi:hypothetical protein